MPSRREGSIPSLGTMLTKTQAEELAHTTGEPHTGIIAKVGTWVTNGVEKYVVHVTHETKINPRIQLVNKRRGVEQW